MMMALNYEVIKKKKRMLMLRELMGTSKIQKIVFEWES